MKQKILIQLSVILVNSFALGERLETTLESFEQVLDTNAVNYNISPLYYETTENSHPDSGYSRLTWVADNIYEGTKALRWEYSVHNSESWGGFQKIGLSLEDSTKSFDFLSYDTLSLMYYIETLCSEAGRVQFRLNLCDVAESPDGDSTAYNGNAEYYYSMHDGLLDNDPGWHELKIAIENQSSWDGTAFNLTGWSGVMANEVIDKKHIKSIDFELSISGAGEGDSRTGVILLDKLSLIKNIETGTVTDIDGNVYKTVKIGDQWWMAENLRVTHYQDGTPIPNITDGTEWSSLGNIEKGAYCAYDNDESNVDIYGYLYNWYAVNDTAIAPAGWHVPSDDEWEELAQFISNDNNGYNNNGGDWNYVGTHLKSHTGWYSEPATNDYDFSALPAGKRKANGLYYYVYYDSFFWSATEYDNDFAWNGSLAYKNHEFSLYFNGTKGYGLSVRCLKDAPGNNFISIATAKADNNNDGTPDLLNQQVTITGTVSAESWAYGNQYYYVQDAEDKWSGIRVWDADRGNAYGDSVRITGTLDENYGLTQLKDITEYVKIESGKTVVPVIVTTGEIGTGGINAEAYESVLVRVENASITNPDAEYGQWMIDDDSGELMIDDQSQYYFNPSAYSSVKSITGPLTYAYSDHKIIPRGAWDIVEDDQYTRIQRVQQVRHSDLIKTVNDLQSDKSYMLGDTVKVKGIVTMGTGISYAGAGIKFIFQQEGGGPWSSLLCYNADSTAYPKLLEGDIIEMTGFIEEYTTGSSNLTEFFVTSPINILNFGQSVANPDTINTGDLILLEKAEQWECNFVIVENAAVTDTSSQYELFTIDDGSGEVKIDDDAYGMKGYSDTNIGDMYSSIKGWVYHFYGSYENGDTYKLCPLEPSDLVIGNNPNSKNIIFTIDMTTPINDGLFNPDTQFVDVAGNFNGWSGTLLSDEDNDNILEGTIGQFAPDETLEYKFRIDGSWDDDKHEFSGGDPSRVFTVGDRDTTVAHIWNVRQNMTIFGNINYLENNKPIPASIKVSGSVSDTINSLYDGSYLIEQVFGNIITEAFKTDSIQDINGLDLLRLKNYLLGIGDTTANMLNAAKCNDDSDVNIFDLLRIKNYLLGYAVDPPMATWQFEPNQYIYSPLTQNMTDQNFIGYLAGDVNLDWGTQSNGGGLAKSSSAGNIYFERLHNDQGNRVRLAIITDTDLNTAILDWNIKIDTTYFGFDKMTSNFLTENNANFSENSLNIVWIYGGEEEVLEAGSTIAELYIEPRINQGQQTIQFSGDNIVADKNENCYQIVYNDFTIDMATTSIDENIIVPEKTTLYPNYPNPFNPVTTIKYFLKDKSNVKICIYNINGQLLKSFEHKNQSVGFHQVQWNATDQRSRSLPSGLYFYQLQYNGNIKVNKMILMK